MKIKGSLKEIYIYLRKHVPMKITLDRTCLANILMYIFKICDFISNRTDI